MRSSAAIPDSAASLADHRCRSRGWLKYAIWSLTSYALKRTRRRCLGAGMACKTGMVCHDEVREAAYYLAGISSKGHFTVDAIVAELRRRGCTHRESTIRTHVTSRMCVNASDHHPVVYADLRRVGVGVYCLADPSDLA